MTSTQPNKRSSVAVLVTGGTSGLGRNTVLELARRGRSVIVGGRRRDAVEALCKEAERRGCPSATPFVADLSDLDSLREAIEQLGAQELHGIVANAGITSEEDQRSQDGYELVFAVNVLAHQLMLFRLADRIVDGGRAVIVSSGVQDPDNKLARRAGLPLPRWIGMRKLALPNEATDEERVSDAQERYVTSKLGNILQARGLQERLRVTGKSVDVFAIDPGLMVDTRLMRGRPPVVRGLMKSIGRIATLFVDNMRTSRTSARYIASLIEDDEWDGRGFAYLDGKRIKPVSENAMRDDLVADLWRESAPLLGVSESDTKLPLE